MIPATCAGEYAGGLAGGGGGPTMSSNDTVTVAVMTVAVLYLTSVRPIVFSSQVCFSYLGFFTNWITLSDLEQACSFVIVKLLEADRKT